MRYWLERALDGDFYIYEGEHEAETSLAAVVYGRRYVAEFVLACLQALEESDKLFNRGNCTASEARLAHEAFLNACAAARSRWLIRPTP